MVVGGTLQYLLSSLLEANFGNFHVWECVHSATMLRDSLARLGIQAGSRFSFEVNAPVSSSFHHHGGEVRFDSQSLASPRF